MVIPVLQSFVRIEELSRESFWVIAEAFQYLVGKQVFKMRGTNINDSRRGHGGSVRRISI